MRARRLNLAVQFKGGENSGFRLVGYFTEAVGGMSDDISRSKQYHSLIETNRRMIITYDRDKTGLVLKRHEQSSLRRYEEVNMFCRGRG